MHFVCLDLEGVLVPEIWIAFAERTAADGATLIVCFGLTNETNRPGDPAWEIVEDTGRHLHRLEGKPMLLAWGLALPHH